MKVEPKWWQGKPVRKVSDKREVSLAEQMGARQHKGSGSLVEKHDMSTEDLLIELKTTEYKSFSINLSYWKKLFKLAKKRLKEPVMVVEIQGTQVAIIDLEFLNQLVRPKEE